MRSMSARPTALPPYVSDQSYTSIHVPRPAYGSSANVPDGASDGDGATDGRATEGKAAGAVSGGGGVGGAVVGGAVVGAAVVGGAVLGGTVVLVVVDVVTGAAA